MSTRAVLTAFAAALAVLFAIVQLGSMALYGDLAQPPAVPPLLSPALGIALGRPLGSPRAPAFLRAAYAQALLHRDDVAGAAAIVALLPDGPAAADLQGQLAERRGDPAAALPLYARARDFERAQRLIDAYDARGDFAQAARLEARLVDVLGGAAAAAVRGRALWRLGQITQELAAGDAASGGTLTRQALAYYERALVIAPNEETYLLAAGQQALTLGDKGAAAAYYVRALEAVPNSADARAGLDRARS
jgi:tetratricopeptide (TPR) repeat protein